MSTIKVVLLGFGTVGRAFSRYVASARQDLQLVGVADSSGGYFLQNEGQLASILESKEQGKTVGETEPRRTLSDHREFIRSVARHNVSVLVEALPTNLDSGQPALDLISLALQQGLNVVTVDKGAVVHGFESLSRLARESDARLAFTGTTGVRPPGEIEGKRVLEIRGVLNGTTNYLLNRMQDHRSTLADALREAQAAGIAEPDPSLDVEGWDTALKTLILARSLMDADTRLDEVSRLGLGPDTESLIETARKAGKRVRLVGRARRYQGKVRVSVAPKLVDPDSPFYSLEETSKLALFRTESGRTLTAEAASGLDAIARVIEEDIRSVTDR